MPDEVLWVDAYMIPAGTYAEQDEEMFLVANVGMTLGDLLEGDCTVVAECYSMADAIRIAKAWNRENQN